MPQLLRRPALAGLLRLCVVSGGQDVPLRSGGDNSASRLTLLPREMGALHVYLALVQGVRYMTALTAEKHLFVSIGRPVQR